MALPVSTISKVVDWPSRPYLFTLFQVHGVPLLFQCETEDDRDSWITSLVAYAANPLILPLYLL